MPIGPVAAAAAAVAAASASAQTPSSIAVVVRYMYEGGHIGQGRLCRISLRPPDASDGGGGAALLPAAAVMRALRDDGVDLDAFYATAYESTASGGGWMPLEPAPRHRNPWNDDAAAVAAADVDDDVDDDDVVDDCGARRRRTAKGPSSSSLSSLAFPIPPRGGDGGGSAPRRIDVKLFRRPKVPTIRGSGVAGEGVGDDRPFEGGLRCVEYSSDALGAMSASVPCGKVAVDGYFGIGVSYLAGGARDARTRLGVSSASYRTKLETDTSRAIQSPATHSNDNENGR
jgi:hypothetical protein